MWSVGCILGEITAILNNVKEQKEFSQRNKQVLFYGTSCYPLSPRKCAQNDLEIKINNSDQLSQIIQKMGPFKDEDLEFI